MGIIHQLSPHVADLIAAGEVVERPASVVKELLENAVDAGAKHVSVEIQNGGMTFIRVTDDGCGMSPEDAEIAFLRHATSKIRAKEDLEAIGTLGFRGEALAAIAAVSKIDLLTRAADESFGTSLRLEAGRIVQRTEAGCPPGTTIIVRDLFYNTPVRMKFMKRDSAEGAAVFSVVQKQAVAHPEVAVRFLRDGKEELSTPGDGQLLSAIYAVFGRQTAMDMVELQSSWEKTRVRGYISKPTASRGNRNYQIFFVNGRYVKSHVLSAALEEAYRNQMMVGRFPACVLELSMPLGAVDVNIHPAKTEVKFLNERDAFDCVYYGALSALNRTSGKVDASIPRQQSAGQVHAPVQTPARPAREKKPFFQTMTAEQYRAAMTPPKTSASDALVQAVRAQTKPDRPPLPSQPPKRPAPAEPPIPKTVEAPEPESEPEQTAMPLPETVPWRIIGECFRTYFLVEADDALYLIDKHAAHERILFDKLRAAAGPVPAQSLAEPLVCRISAEEAAIVLERKALLAACGYGVEEFGAGTVLLREIPADIDPGDARETLSELAQRLLEGRRTEPETLRDELLHTVACKAAIKAGYRTDELEREALVRRVMDSDDLKYCPHGRPICIRLSKGQIERQFGRA